MTRYVIKKYITADSLADALKKEPSVKAEEVWKDEKQDDSSKPDVIGFRINEPTYYYSPYMKPTKKPKPKAKKPVKKK